MQLNISELKLYCNLFNSDETWLHQLPVLPIAEHEFDAYAQLSLMLVFWQFFTG